MALIFFLYTIPLTKIPPPLTTLLPLMLPAAIWYRMDRKPRDATPLPVKQSIFSCCDFIVKSIPQI